MNKKSKVYAQNVENGTGSHPHTKDKKC